VRRDLLAALTRISAEVGGAWRSILARRHTETVGRAEVEDETIDVAHEDWVSGDVTLTGRGVRGRRCCGRAVQASDCPRPCRSAVYTTDTTAGSGCGDRRQPTPDSTSSPLGDGVAAHAACCRGSARLGRCSRFELGFEIRLACEHRAPPAGLVFYVSRICFTRMVTRGVYTNSSFSFPVCDRGRRARTTRASRAPPNTKLEANQYTAGQAWRVIFSLATRSVLLACWK
jgi:hypothetical protein